jgi:hypothetical protein
MKTRNHEIDNPQKEVNQVQRRICSWSTLIAIIAALLFVVFQEKAIAKGILLGTLFSIINFILLGKSIPLALGQTRPRAGMIGLASILGRYVLLAIPMVIAIKSSSINFIAVVVGIFAVQIVTLFNYIVIRPLMEGK